MGLHVMAAVPEYSSILYAKVIKSISTAVPEHKQRIPKRFPLIIFFNRDIMDCHSIDSESWGQGAGEGGRGDQVPSKNNNNNNNIA